MSWAIYITVSLCFLPHNFFVLLFVIVKLYNINLKFDGKNLVHREAESGAQKLRI